MSDAIQYWINQNGIQTGPHTIEELQQMDITSGAYVWRAGMDDWKPITTIPELASVYDNNMPQDAVGEPPAATPTEEAGAMAEEAPTADFPPIPVIPEPEATRMPPVPQTAAAQIPEQQPEPKPMPKCPPTNLAWAIISALLCCLPLGVVAIIYSTKVSQKYQQGDIEAAEHYSEVSAWWCIGTIVGGIILSPFVSLIQMAIMG